LLFYSIMPVDAEPAAPGGAPAAGRRVRRPSHREKIKATALELAARGGPEALTISAIAAAAGLTPPAVYYHYPSKDAVLLEGLRDLGSAYLDALARATEAARRSARPGQIAVELLGWAADTPHIRAYFIAGPNLTPPIAALLHEHRVQAVTLLHDVTLHAPDGPSAAEAAVLAVALLSLLETAITAACAGDRSVRALGRGMFAQEIAELIEAVIAG
jgi:AcrR family transcriptional regulator